MAFLNGQTCRRWIGRVLQAAVAMTCLAAVQAWAAPERDLPAPGPLADVLGPARTIRLHGTVFHVQGLEMDDDAIYVTSLNKKTRHGYLHKFTRAGDLVQTVDVTDGQRDHPGGISLDADTLWVPIAESHAGTSARIVQFDKHTLTPRASFRVTDHIGAIAVHGDRLYGANYRTRSFYVWDRAGKPIASSISPTQVQYQDMKMVGDDLVASGLMADGTSGAIDWLDPETFAPRQRLALGKMESGLVWTQEGMKLQGNTLYLMPMDGGDEGVDIFVFDLPEMTAAQSCMTAGANRCLFDKRRLAAR